MLAAFCFCLNFTIGKAEMLRDETDGNSHSVTQRLREDPSLGQPDTEPAAPMTLPMQTLGCQCWKDTGDSLSPNCIFQREEHYGEIHGFSQNLTFGASIRAGIGRLVSLSLSLSLPSF